VKSSTNNFITKKNINKSYFGLNAVFGGLFFGVFNLIPFFVNQQIFINKYYYTFVTEKSSDWSQVCHTGSKFVLVTELTHNFDLISQPIYLLLF
jgi:hypothetical protein